MKFRKAESARLNEPSFADCILVMSDWEVVSLAVVIAVGSRDKLWVVNDLDSTNDSVKHVVPVTSECFEPLSSWRAEAFLVEFQY
jgi:hypothetical protein